MGKLYVPLNVDFATDPKMLAAGPNAAYLYLCSLAYCKRTAKRGGDGVVHRNQLRVLALGQPSKPERLAAALVEVGLWEECDEGWSIPAWLKHNPSSDTLAQRTAQAKVKSLLGNHEQHHVAKNKPDVTCILCFPEHDNDDSPQGALVRQILARYRDTQQVPHGEPHGEPHGDPKTLHKGKGREKEKEKEKEGKGKGEGREKEEPPSTSSKLTLVATPPPEEEEEGEVAFDRLIDETIHHATELRLNRAKKRPEGIGNPTRYRAVLRDQAHQDLPEIRSSLAKGLTPTEAAHLLVYGTTGKAEAF